MSIKRGIDKEDVTHRYNRILLSHKKKNEIMPLVESWMQLEIINYHTKWRKWERQTPCDITYMWTLKYDTHEPTYETESET